MNSVEQPAPRSEILTRATRLASIEPVALAGLTLLGVFCGVLAKTADESGISWAGDLGTYPAAWVLALALIAWFAPGPGRAAARGATFFVGTCLAYYGWAVVVMGFSIDRNLVLWTGLAITAVPVLSAATQWAGRHHGLLAAGILATVAALALADGIVWQLWWAWGGGGAPEGFPLRPFQAFTNLAVALTIVGVLPRNHLTRLLAVVLLIPGAIVIAGVVDQLMSILIGML